MNFDRVRLLNKANLNDDNSPILYWMSREQRVNDNWGLLFSQLLALKHKRPLCVIFCITDNFLGANFRHYDFMLKGLMEVESNLRQLDIPFYILNGSAEKVIPSFVSDYKIGALISDFNPLKIHQYWCDSLASTLDIPIYQVDSHNIVPCWIASSKQEYAAYTIRPKINKALHLFLDDFPVLKQHPYKWEQSVPIINWKLISNSLNVDRSILPIRSILSGEKAAFDSMNSFIETKLASYHSLKNDPLANSVSGLSPYLHYGQISAQRIAIEVTKNCKNQPSRDAFLEELIIRKELSDNFCYYNKSYDNTSCFPNWAKETLTAHLTDTRLYCYTSEDFEGLSTHDELWNACQSDLALNGKIHGYLRMYWAKKILEWTSTPDEAMKIAIYLNDKYALDGRDPNGYTGIAWSIGGIHDRPWFDRPVFGKIRYMNENGCKKKFDVKKYIDQFK